MSFEMTIDDRTVTAMPGQTVMEAATAAGIHIPGLCHHQHLPSLGACRLCVVEIERQRGLQPACTFPAAEGLVVRTETPKIVAARKFAVEMLFSERTHYCMTCPVSGGAENTDCDLQMLAYRYGMTHWMFAPDASHAWKVDATRPYFIMDHGRCILCRRCVRACASMAANHTLGVHQRGARTLIGADDDLSFDQSSCVSCGSCLQVCPTGALTDRSSAFAGRESEMTRVKTICSGCAVGCGIEVLVRDNNLVRIDGDWDAPNAGLLCAEGRFMPTQPAPPRITRPLVRREGKLLEAGWDEALEVAADSLRGADRPAGLISPRMTTRLLAGFASLFNETLGSDRVALLYGQVPPMDLGTSATLADVGTSDCIVGLGVDPLKDQKVVGYLVKRAVDAGATLLLVNDQPTPLDRLAGDRVPLKHLSPMSASPFAQLHYSYHLGAGGLSRVKAAVASAHRPVILYAPGLSPTAYAGLRSMHAKAKFLPMVRGANAMGAHRLGLTARPVEAPVTYVLLGDDSPEVGAPSPATDFLIVQSAHRNAWTDAADVVLPARTWAEKPGLLMNLEGRRQRLTPLLKEPPGVRADLETLVLLSAKLGSPLSFDLIVEMCDAV